MIAAVQGDVQGSELPAVVFKRTVQLQSLQVLWDEEKAIIVQQLLSQPVKWDDEGANIVQVDILMGLPERVTRFVAIPFSNPITEKVINESIQLRVIKTHQKRAALTEKESCAIQQLSTVYDEGVGTAVHNDHDFHANLKKIQVGTDARTEMKENAGVINLQEGCTIKIQDLRIKSSSDQKRPQDQAIQVKIEKLERAEATPEVTNGVTGQAVTTQFGPTKRYSPQTPDRRERDAEEVCEAVRLRKMTPKRNSGMTNPINDRLVAGACSRSIEHESLHDPKLAGN